MLTGFVKTNAIGIPTRAARLMKLLKCVLAQPLWPMLELTTGAERLNLKV